MKYQDSPGVVYNSELGRMCPQCGNAQKDCICKEQAKLQVQGNGNVRVGRETAGRKGSGVTVISGLPLAQIELEALARKLKARCGSGGTIKDGLIEIQGEHRDTLVAELLKIGYAAKRVGG